jgi:hypothetical protein
MPLAVLIEGDLPSSFFLLVAFALHRPEGVDYLVVDASSRGAVQSCAGPTSPERTKAVPFSSPRRLQLFFLLLDFFSH